MMEDRQYEQQALEALKKAVANALERKRRLGQYAVVWRDGQLVRLSPDQIRKRPRQADSLKIDTSPVICRRKSAGG